MSLYSTISATVQLENNAIEPTQMYSQLTPEKPSVLAEERVFVYIPKATYNSYGIAKFLPTQFTIVNGEVQLNPHFITTLKEALARPDLITSVEEPEDIQLWYKVIESTG